MSSTKDLLNSMFSRKRQGSSCGKEADTLRLLRMAVSHIGADGGIVRAEGNGRADRYIGYIGETLETLYFMKNSDGLNIVHTECRLYT